MEPVNEDIEDVDSIVKNESESESDVSLSDKSKSSGVNDIPILTYMAPTMDNFYVSAISQAFAKPNIQTTFSQRSIKPTRKI